jgi:hypothetical protein
VRAGKLEHPGHRARSRIAESGDEGRNGGALEALLGVGEDEHRVAGCPHAGVEGGGLAAGHIAGHYPRAFIQSGQLARGRLGIRRIEGDDDLDQASRMIGLQQVGHPRPDGLGVIAAREDHRDAGRLTLDRHPLPPQTGHGAHGKRVAEPDDDERQKGGESDVERGHGAREDSVQRRAERE